MSPTSASHARSGFAGRAWHGFRRWRRTRPFWGGLFVVLSGVEIFLTTQMSLSGLSFQLGPTGFLSWLVPTILVACGVLAWVTPAQRLFYAIVAVVTAVFSLIGVNLGGFFVGLILGIVGAGLVFAWTPGTPAVAAAADGEDSPGSVDDADTGELPAEGVAPGLEDPDRDAAPVPGGSVPTQPGPVVPAQPAGEVAEGGAADTKDDADPAPLPRRESPRFYTVVGFLLVLAASAVLGLRVAAPAHAAAAAPCPKPAGTAAPKPGETTAPAPSPTPTDEEDDRGIIGSIIDGITGIFNRGSDEKDGAAAASPTPTPEPSGTAKPSAADCASAPGAPTDEEGDQAAVPLLKADGSVPSVNSKPSLLTGTKLTMWGLRVEGIYPLDTPAGEVRALKFTMSRSVVETFALRVPQGSRDPLLFESRTLTVRGDVAFYATRFVGRIAGIKLTLTPRSPLPPDGIPLTIPKIVFDDPQIQLMYVSCDQLLAPTLDEGFVAA